MIDAVNAITSDQEWRAATGLPRQPSSSSHDEQEEKLPRCWLRAASKHLKILEVVLGVAEVNEKNGAPDDPRRLPFHPLHCAASQGMTSAGRILLQRYSGTGNKEVRAFFFRGGEMWVGGMRRLVRSLEAFFRFFGPIRFWTRAAYFGADFDYRHFRQDKSYNQKREQRETLHHPLWVLSCHQRGPRL